MTDTTLILKAASFAALRHRNQRRKDVDAFPYINHPLELARVLAEEGGVTDAATLCAALLHDTVEDTDTKQGELEREFGVEIAGIVSEVTDDTSLRKADRKRMQVEHAAHISEKAKLVKLADKICNLRDVATAPPRGGPCSAARSTSIGRSRSSTSYVAFTPAWRRFSMTLTKRGLFGLPPWASSQPPALVLVSPRRTRSAGCLVTGSWPFVCFRQCASGAPASRHLRLQRG